MTAFKGEAIVLDSDDAKYSVANSEFLIKKYSAFYNNLIRSLRNPIGSYKRSPLSEAEFQLENGSSWVLCDGQDITGSDLYADYGVTNAPDMVTNYHWITQTDDDANLNNESDNENEDHYHFLVRRDVGGSPTNISSGTDAIDRTLFGEMTSATEENWAGNSTSEPTLATTQPMATSKARPNTCKVNTFIRINRD